MDMETINRMNRFADLERKADSIYFAVFPEKFNKPGEGADASQPEDTRLDKVAVKLEKVLDLPKKLAAAEARIKELENPAPAMELVPEPELTPATPPAE